MNKIDEKIQSILSDKIGQQISRRSAIGKISKALFGLVGISVLGKVFPLVVDAEAAPLAWQTCGRSGVECTPTHLTGGGWASSWQVCCKDPSCNKWACCTYKDYCRGTPPNDEAPPMPWCNAQYFYYACTQTACATATHETAEACGRACVNTCGRGGS